MDALDTPEAHMKMRKIFYVLLAATIIPGFLISWEHVHYSWEKVPVWGAVYGFASCVIIVILSKFYGHHLVMKEEDYYD